jgi:hypothetical protein
MGALPRKPVRIALKLGCSSTAGRSIWVLRSRLGSRGSSNGLGIEPASLGYRAACHGGRLHQLEHRDPAGRLLITTAIELACPLVTYDERILRFADDYGCQYRFEAKA